ncbi:hypothetical protein [Hymenobacter crusticola]|uniref:Uncharacterized protein n=1 Tax=Hymenobacter crusticola TaxID=1770526 RepID=A0A243WJW3_9BACT|nr:hypothetical protein [Hymenobacter crusticola]OUJ76188.1 hypothetical protein BXP70_02665 [Hymenobacter crusticola]
MPYKSNNTNHQSKENHGSPSTSEQHKAAGNMPLGKEGEEVERLADEYTNDGLDEIPSDLQRHPNRNHDKPSLDKPSYS